jgi:hypothetical protein
VAVPAHPRERRVRVGDPAIEAKEENPGSRDARGPAEPLLARPDGRRRPLPLERPDPLAAAKQVDEDRHLGL